jgi:hypothetical protein
MWKQAVRNYGITGAILLALVGGCATQSGRSSAGKRPKQTVETKVQRSIDWSAQTSLIRKKMAQFDRALSSGKLSDTDWKIHDELLDEYVRLKGTGGSVLLVPERSKVILAVETYCLDSKKASPAEREVFEWKRGLPDIRYYQELLEARKRKQLSQDEVQELIWNLKNNTRWDEYPPRLQSILLKIDPQAAVKLPSRIKDQAKSIVTDTILGLPGAQEVLDHVQFAEGKFYELKDFKDSIERLKSTENLANYDDLAEIPNTGLFSQSRSSGYHSQALTLFNPSDDPRSIDLHDYYLKPERSDVQPIGVFLASSSDPALLSDLEKLLFEKMARLGIGFTPGLNDVADLYELMTGKDLMSGEALSPSERALSALGLVAGSGAGYRMAKRMIHAPGTYADDFARGFKNVSGKELGSADIKAAEKDLLKATQRERKVRTAEEAIREFPQDFRPPYKSGTKVTEFNTAGDEKFVRLHGKENQARRWIVRKEAVAGSSAKDLKAKYSLPEVPSEISDVKLPPGVPLRRGRVAENFGGRSGAVQYEILTKPEDSWFLNRRTLK